MVNFRVKLDTVEWLANACGLLAKGRHGYAVGYRQQFKFRGQLKYGITMTHPNL